MCGALSESDLVWSLHAPAINSAKHISSSCKYPCAQPVNYYYFFQKRSTGRQPYYIEIPERVSLGLLTLFDMTSSSSYRNHAIVWVKVGTTEIFKSM